jgi:hypothetical protein
VDSLPQLHKGYKHRETHGLVHCMCANTQTDTQHSQQQISFTPSPTHPWAPRHIPRYQPLPETKLSLSQLTCKQLESIVGEDFSAADTHSLSLICFSRLQACLYLHSSPISTQGQTWQSTSKLFTIYRAFTLL